MSNANALWGMDNPEIPMGYDVNIKEVNMFEAESLIQLKALKLP
jgi:hypothetical protein